jgi:hypothetical protein
MTAAGPEGSDDEIVSVVDFTYTNAEQVTDIDYLMQIRK